MRCSKNSSSWYSNLSDAVLTLMSTATKWEICRIKHFASVGNMVLEDAAPKKDVRCRRVVVGFNKVSASLSMSATSGGARSEVECLMGCPESCRAKIGK